MKKIFMDVNISIWIKVAYLYELQLRVIMHVKADVFVSGQVVFKLMEPYGVGSVLSVSLLI